MNNNIKDSYCSFEVSKLLKKKGFDVPCEYGYNSHEDGHRLNGVVRNFTHGYSRGLPKERNSELQTDVTRPTTSIAIEWLRVNFGYHIFITAGTGNSYFPKIIAISEEANKKIGGYLKELNWHSSPQEATEDALLYTLNNLVNGKEISINIQE